MSPVWYLLMMVSAGSHQQQVKMVFETQQECKDKYAFAQKTATETKVTVKGACFPGPRPNRYGQHNDDSD